MSTNIATQHKIEQELEESRHRNEARRSKITAATQRSKQRALVQSANCEICGKRVDGAELSLDHCHTTDQIRGYLCRTCNAGLGMFRDDPKILGKAIKYLHWYSLRSKDAA